MFTYDQLKKFNIKIKPTPHCDICCEVLFKNGFSIDYSFNEINPPDEDGNEFHHMVIENQNNMVYDDDMDEIDASPEVMDDLIPSSIEEVIEKIKEVATWEKKHY